MLQVSEGSPEHPELTLEQLRVCEQNGTPTITRTKVANLKWPPFGAGSLVPRRMDYLCETYANEESTLVTSSPSILYNAAYESSSLLLTVKNKVFQWDITSHLSHIRHTSCECVSASSEASAQCEDYGALPATLSSAGVVASLIGPGNLDHAASESSVQVATNKEMLFVFSGFNTLSSVDLSLEVPCGLVWDTLLPRFYEWQVPVGQYRRAQGEVQLQRAAGGEAKPWQYTATKQVSESKTTTGASLIKNTVCCSAVGVGGRMPCCVKKRVSFTEGVTATITPELAQELSAK